MLIKKILINYKRNISFLFDDKHNTLLHLYTKKNEINNLEIILQVYIDILHYSNDFYIFLFSKNIDNKTVFNISIQNNNISITKLLFHQIEKELNSKNKEKHMNYIKDNIFHICAEYNQYYLIIFFYEKFKKYFKFFDISQIICTKYKDQMNPLHISCDKENKKILSLLIDLGGDINSKDTNNYTPLHHAVLSGNEKLTKYLLLRGANKFIKDWKNRTPYDLALSMNKKKLVNLLYHKNYCARKVCGGEIEPLTKTNNHCFLLISIFFTIILKLIIIFRFFFIFMAFYNFNSNYNKMHNNNKDNNNTFSNELSINNFFNCIDENCKFEKSIIFISLFTDFLVLLVIIIFKCSKNIFLEKKSKKEVKSLSTLYKNNENICVKCRIPITSSIKHCFICNRCINNWDHHCYWLNSCINDINYGKFKLFLFSALLFLISNFLFYIDLIFLFFNLKEPFFELIVNANNEILIYIFRIVCVIIDIYILVVILYSLIFIIIPIVKNIVTDSIDDNIDKINTELFENVLDDDNINTGKNVYYFYILSLYLYFNNLLLIINIINYFYIFLPLY